MSISYEQALETLTSMFGPPWTEETLDEVLRHFDGHMENTVESVLSHGNGEPEALLKKLKNGDDNAQSSAEQISMDEAIAMQMMQDEQARQRQAEASMPPALRRATGTGTATTTTTTTTATSAMNPNSSSQPMTEKKGRGTPTQLPPDFLRIPGQMDPDEALARMLQNEVFAKEVKKNPEFANNANLFRNRNAAQGNNHAGPNQGHNIMEALSDMGEAAKSKLSMIANRFNQNRNKPPSERTSGGLGGSSGKGERQGLLNNEEPEEEISFAKPSGSNIDFEMADWNDPKRK